MSNSMLGQFEVTSGISGETLAEVTAAACLLVVTLWVSWVALSSLRQLRDETLAVGDVASRILWGGLVFCMVVALIAFVE